MKQHIEKQTILLVRSEYGKVEAITLRGSIIRHGHCGCDHSSRVGDLVFWHKLDFNMTRVDGVVIATKHQYWDYNMPIGDRGRNVVTVGQFDQIIKSIYRPI